MLTMTYRRSDEQYRGRAAFLGWLPVLALVFAANAGASALAPGDFRSDGCSLFPDGSVKDRALWCDCCFAHDIAYWRGGTKEERKEADAKLRECVLERTRDKALAEVMYAGVRAGGHPVFPAWYRWGYGWKYGRGYRPLTQQEERQVRGKLDDYFQKHPSGYCRSKEEVKERVGER